MLDKVAEIQFSQTAHGRSQGKPRPKSGKAYQRIFLKQTLAKIERYVHRDGGGRGIAEILHDIVEQNIAGNSQQIRQLLQHEAVGLMGKVILDFLFVHTGIGDDKKEEYCSLYT